MTAGSICGRVPTTTNVTNYGLLRIPTYTALARDVLANPSRSSQTPFVVCNSVDFWTYFLESMISNPLRQKKNETFFDGTELSARCEFGHNFRSRWKVSIRPFSSIKKYVQTRSDGWENRHWVQLSPRKLSKNEIEVNSDLPLQCHLAWHSWYVFCYEEKLDSMLIFSAVRPSLDIFLMLEKGLISTFHLDSVANQ